MIGVFTLLYIGGAYLGAREGLMFYQRFRRVVRRNEINGLKIKHLDMYMGGGYLLLDPKELKVLDGYERDELVVAVSINFDTVVPKHVDDDWAPPPPPTQAPVVTKQASADGKDGNLFNGMFKSSRAKADAPSDSGPIVPAIVPPPPPKPRDIRRRRRFRSG